MKSKFLVPFETAKALKEKGYNSLCDCYYMPDKELYLGILVSNMDYEDCGNCSAPTYHEVVDWLYEKKICITCHPAYSYEGQYNGFQYEMQTYDEDDYPDDIYHTREEALNAGILKALEML